MTREIKRGRQRDANGNLAILSKATALREEEEYVERVVHSTPDNADPTRWPLNRSRFPLPSRFAPERYRGVRVAS